MSKNFREGFRLILCNCMFVKSKSTNISKQHEKNDRQRKSEQGFNFEQNKLLSSNN